MSVTTEEIMPLLIKAKLQNDRAIFMDRTWSLPSVSYPADLGERLMRWMLSMGYQPKSFDSESLDCDDYAVQAWAHARRDHAKFSKTEHGIAFGMAGTVLHGAPHSINLAVHRVDGQLELRFYEPQPQPPELEWNQLHKDPECLRIIPPWDVPELIFAIF